MERCTMRKWGIPREIPRRLLILKLTEEIFETSSWRYWIRIALCGGISSRTYRRPAMGNLDCVLQMGGKSLRIVSSAPMELGQKFGVSFHHRCLATLASALWT